MPEQDWREFEVTVVDRWLAERFLAQWRGLRRASSGRITLCASQVWFGAQEEMSADFVYHSPGRTALTNTAVHSLSSGPVVDG